MSSHNLPGEKLTKEEAKGLMKELCEPEDDEGFMPFMRKSILTHFVLSIQKKQGGVQGSGK